MPNRQIRVPQGLLTSDPPRRVKLQQPPQKIQPLWVRPRVYLLKRHSRLDRQTPDVLLRSRRANSSEGVLGGCSEEVQDLVELVDVIAAFEDWFTPEEFGEDAADGPHVD